MTDRRTWSFTDLGPADVAALTALFERNARSDVTTRFDPFPLDAATARAIVTLPRRDRYFAARADDGRLLGMSMLRGWDEGFEVPSFGVFVDRDEQGRGVGSGLLDETLEAARRLSAPAVRLTVYSDNDVALALYRSRGFVETERRPGRQGEAIVMVLDLGGLGCAP